MQLKAHIALVLLAFCGCNMARTSMNQLEEQDPWVIRTDFTDDAAWSNICKLISAPQREIGQDFYAYVQFKDDRQFENVDANDLVHSLPDDYPGFFVFVIDSKTLESDEHPILVIGFSPTSLELEDYERTPKQTPVSEIRTFRAIPATIQSIENNLSIANMDFEEFAEAVAADGVFRGFDR